MAFPIVRGEKKSARFFRFFFFFFFSFEAKTKSPSAIFECVCLFYRVSVSFRLFRFFPMHFPIAPHLSCFAHGESHDRKARNNTGEELLIAMSAKEKLRRTKFAIVARLNFILEDARASFCPQLRDIVYYFRLSMANSPGRPGAFSLSSSEDSNKGPNSGRISTLIENSWIQKERERKREGRFMRRDPS